MTAREQARKAAWDAAPFTSLVSVNRAADAASDVWETYMRRILGCWNNTELWDDEAAFAAINTAREALGIELLNDDA